MFSIPEQFSNATKTHVENQFAVFSALTSQAFEGIEKLAGLNLAAARTSLEDSSSTARQLLSARDPQALFSLSAAQARPAVEKAVAYARQASSIASGTAAGLSNVAKAQFSETNRKVLSLMDEAGKNAPAGSANVVALFKSALGNASAGYEQLTLTAKQASDAIEANVNTAVGQFNSAVTNGPAAAAFK